MPRHEYVCAAGHVTERITALSKTPPKTIDCKAQTGTAKTATRELPMYCHRRAQKAQVYRVSVQGDLPTRGAF